ncbi:MAG TPA: hypothetical protein VJS64_07465 [Pyrinomonadaceae bacterium]|nr:hypothetical protein [Pyrinomonadaceae bacterium]
MKRIGCKSFINEIDEIEPGQAPSASVTEHVQGCASCRGFYDDRLKLREMIAGLETVEAPGDFDFRLRARLANEPSKSAPPFSVAGFGFGLPSIALAIVALLVGVGLYTRFMTESSVEQPRAQAPIPVASNPGVKLENLNAIKVVETAQTTTDLVPIETNDRRVRRANRNVNSNIRHDDFVAKSETASMFPLEATEPLRVSVDYATGGSRTISLPAVSFGSQQVVASGGSMVKTSARTVW